MDQGGEIGEGVADRPGGGQKKRRAGKEERK